MKRVAAVLAILAAIYFLPTIGMNVASSSRGVSSVVPSVDSWIVRKYGSWQELRSFRIAVDPSKYPDLEAVVAAARPTGKLIEKSPGDVVYQSAVESGLERAIEFRMQALDDPEKVENTLTVVEATRCSETFACYRLSLMSSFDSARSAYRLSNLAGIRKTPGAG